MNKGQKQKILQNKRIKYNEMDHSKKLLTKNMNYRKTMSIKNKSKKHWRIKELNMKQWINQRKKNC